MRTKKRLAIFCECSGPGASLQNLQRLVKSIKKTIGISDYQFYFVTDQAKVASKIINFCPKVNLLEIVKSGKSYADDFNKFYDLFINKFEYFLIVHDDIEFLSTNWFKKIVAVAKRREKDVGWITITNTALHPLESGSVRGGFYIDRLQRNSFECRDPKGIHYPKGPVVTFGPYTHVMFISTWAMKIVGHCNPLNQKYTLLMDEDWSLEALTKGLYNVWIPNLMYNHHRSGKSGLRYEREAHRTFRAKWGFDHPATDFEINKIILRRWPHLSYLTHRYSNDWTYLSKARGSKFSMRISIISSSLTISGGRQKLVLRLCEAMTQLGHDVTIFTPELDRRFCFPNIIRPKSKIKIVSLKNRIDPNDTNWSLIFQTLKLATPLAFKYFLLSKKVGPSDLIILDDDECLLSLPFVTDVQSTRVVWMLNSHLSKKLISFKKNLIEHLKPVRNIVLLPYLLLTLPATTIDSFLKIFALKWVRTIDCYDSFNASRVQRMIHKDTMVVYAAADLKDYSKIRLKKSSHDPINILSVGVMFPHRRYEDIVKAVKLLINKGVDVNLTIVGRSDLSKRYFLKLINLVKRLHLDQQVIFYEFLTQRQLLELHKKASIFCFVNDANTWGVAAFEAVAARLPVIITKNIGAADIIEDHKTGWVVPPRNPKAIADAVRDIVNKPRLTKSVVKAAKTKILKLLTWRSFAERVIESSRI